jgi:hypothetical protein
MFKKCLAAIFCVIGSASLNAGTVALFGVNDFSQENDWALVDASNVNLSTGYVGVGVFSSISNGNLASSSFSALAADFVALGSDVLLSGSEAFYGDQIAGATAISTDYGAPGANLGKTIYIIIGNNGTLANSTQFALLNTGLTVDADSPTPDSNSPTFNAATVVGSYGTKFTSGGTLDTSGMMGGSENQAASRVQLVAVPEPTAALLGAVGMMGLFRRRRVMA